MGCMSIMILGVAFSIGSAQAGSVCPPSSFECCNNQVKLSYISKCKENGGRNCESMGQRLHNDCMNGR